MPSVNVSDFDSRGLLKFICQFWGTLELCIAKKTSPIGCNQDWTRKQDRFLTSCGMAVDILVYTLYGSRFFKRDYMPMIQDNFKQNRIVNKSCKIVLKYCENLLKSCKIMLKSCLNTALIMFQ